MNDKTTKHVFISYVRENQKQVDRLCEDLKKYGVKIWLDRNDIKPGARWKDAIREAIRQGDYFIACFSKEYTARADREKTYMNEELTLAVDELRQFSPTREWFIPVLLSECEVPPRSIGGGETLLDIQRMPLNEDWEIGIKRIVDLIKPIPNNVQHLIRSLQSANNIFRWQAVSELGRICNSAALPELIKAISDEDKLVRSSAIQAVGNIGDSAALPVLIKATHDEDIEIRVETSKALGKIGDPFAVPTLVKAMNDENLGVRCNVAEALGEIGDPEAVPVLLENLIDNEIFQLSGEKALAYSTYLELNIRIAEALGKLGESSAIEVLIKAMSNWIAKKWAVEALCKIGDLALSALIKALEVEDKMIREGAAEVLGNIGSPEALKAVEKYEKRRFGNT